MLPVHSSSGANNNQTLVVRHVGPLAHQGELSVGEFTFPCALGRSGINRDKTEGDGSTPVGTFELLNVYYRPDKAVLETTHLPAFALSQNDGWCDEADHLAYNRPVELPFNASHERMWREDRLYDVVVVLDCNMFPAVPGRGSAIFFHIAREGYKPTEGCVAVYPEHMKQILALVKPGAHMVIEA
ncbi:L,D-transpeptidase family protein [Pseudovibrio exalbescens]|uniref:L,D-transpeptidase family protein n=1 Tax=Pseudovibrio exalbescens TaxID=197461 RepID=UPI00236581B8|nr:L,D-transpeptidase family protein [Pseudovibrio exalbescens]MDD7909707.1 L,D-transpeptidase family protein [Pseudovibrio exalbescens]